MVEVLVKTSKKRNWLKGASEGGRNVGTCDVCHQFAPIVLVFDDCYVCANCFEDWVELAGYRLVEPSPEDTDPTTWQYPPEREPHEAEPSEEELATAGGDYPEPNMDSHDNHINRW